MVSRTTRGHPTFRNPTSRRYMWPTARATIRYGYCYERDGEQKIFDLSSLDMGPSETMIAMGWRPIFKVRVRPKNI